MASESMAQQSHDDSSIETPSAKSESQRQSDDASCTSGVSEGPIQLPASSKTESAGPQKEPTQHADVLQSTEPDGSIPLTLEVC
jgi:hypothetical protein